MHSVAPKQVAGAFCHKPKRFGISNLTAAWLAYLVTAIALRKVQLLIGLFNRLIKVFSMIT